MACTPTDLEKFSAIAKKEIGETNVNVQEVVEKVRKLISEKYTELRLPPDADLLLERCLRCRKFDLDQAANQVHSYFKLLSDFQGTQKEMLFFPSIHQEYFFESLGFAVFKQRDSKGRIVVLANYERLPIENHDLDKGLAASMLLIDELTRSSVETQRLGVVYVCNFKGYEFGHAKQYTLLRIRTMTRFVQGAFPVRFKGFHVVGSPALFRYTWALVRPFLKEKIRDRVHIHGSDLTEFHEHLSPEILPDFLGGNLTYEESVDLEFTRRLGTKDEYYKELFKYGYMNNAVSQS